MISSKHLQCNLHLFYFIPIRLDTETVGSPDNTAISLRSTFWCSSTNHPGNFHSSQDGQTKLKRVQLNNFPSPPKFLSSKLLFPSPLSWRRRRTAARGASCAARPTGRPSTPAESSDTEAPRTGRHKTESNPRHASRRVPPRLAAAGLARHRRACS